MAVPILIQERRQQVMTLYLQAIKQEALANQFNLTTRSIRKDVASCRRQEARTITKKKKEEVLAELKAKADLRNRQIWSVLSSSGVTKKEKLNALAALQKEEELEIKRYEKAGTLPRDSAQVEINKNDIRTVTINIIEPGEEKTEDVKEHNDQLEAKPETVPSLQDPARQPDD